MKTSVAIVVGFALLGLVSPALAGDPSGIWKWTSTFDNQNRETMLKLRLDSEGSVLSGVYFDGQISQGTPISPTIFNEEDGKIGFSVTREFNGEKFTIKCSGTFNGDSIAGMTQLESGGQVQTSNWVARRYK